MSLHKYFSQVADELKRKSDKVRTGFSEHRPSAGDNREAIVADFLREHLPKAFGVSTGMVLSKSGEYSAQADVLIVDQLWNSPLYPTSPETIWLVEAVRDGRVSGTERDAFERHLPICLDCLVESRLLDEMGL